ncbi:MAG: hypothetical protein MHPSP_000229 [Paramarteilia canceri]
MMGNDEESIYWKLSNFIHNIQPSSLNYHIISKQDSLVFSCDGDKNSESEIINVMVKKIIQNSRVDKIDQNNQTSEMKSNICNVACIPIDHSRKQPSLQKWIALLERMMEREIRKDVENKITNEISKKEQEFIDRYTAEAKKCSDELEIKTIIKLLRSISYVADLIPRTTIYLILMPKKTMEGMDSLMELIEQIINE